MSRRERLVLYTLQMMLATILAACGTSAVQAPTLVPTEVFPTRVAVQPTGGASTGVQPTAAVQPTTALTLAPTQPPATPIPPTPTRSFATVTPQITATSRPAATTAAAPAGNAASGAPGNSANGKTIFQIGLGDPAIPACSSCHNTDSPDIKIGPSLQGLAARAGSRVPGQDAATYLRTSILKPNAFLVPNEDGHVYSAAGTSLMFQDYAKHLTDAQVNDLVAYLLTLK